MNKIGLTEEEELEQNKKIEAYEEAMEYKENHEEDSMDLKLRSGDD